MASYILQLEQNDPVPHNKTIWADLWLLEMLEPFSSEVNNWVNDGEIMGASSIALGNAWVTVQWDKRLHTWWWKNSSQFYGSWKCLSLSIAVKSLFSLVHFLIKLSCLFKQLATQQSQSNFSHHIIILQHHWIILDQSITHKMEHNHYIMSNYRLSGTTQE